MHGSLKGVAFHKLEVEGSGGEGEALPPGIQVGGSRREGVVWGSRRTLHYATVLYLFMIHIYIYLPVRLGSVFDLVRSVSQ